MLNHKFRTMSFQDMAFEVISRFVSEDDIPKDTLRKIVNKSFSKFRSPGNECTYVMLSSFI